jgi:hypothetical protein
MVLDLFVVTLKEEAGFAEAKREVGRVLPPRDERGRDGTDTREAKAFEAEKEEEAESMLLKGATGASSRIGGASIPTFGSICCGCFASFCSPACQRHTAHKDARHTTPSSE